MEFAQEYEWDTTLRNLDKVKSELANKIPKKYYDGKNVPQSLVRARAEIANVFRNQVHTELQRISWVNTARLYLDYGNLKGLAEVGKKAMTQGGRMWWSGQLMSWMFDTLLTPITTIAGKMTHKTWEVISAIPNAVIWAVKQAPNVIKNAIKWWGVTWALIQLGIATWMPAEVAGRIVEQVEMYEKHPDRFIPMEWWIFEAINKSEYEKFKWEDGSISIWWERYMMQDGTLRKVF